MILFMDSFDHYASAQLLNKWDGVSVANPSISGGAARTGTGGLFMDGFTDRALFKSITAGDFFCAGMAFQAAGFGSNDGTLMGFRDGASEQVDIRYNSSKQLYVTRAGTTILGPGTTVLVPNTWYYLELRVTIHDTTGAVTVRLNGANELTGSSLDTRAAGATASRFYISRSGLAYAGNLFVDDLYILDDNGGGAVDLLGDVKVECLLPNGNGNSSQWLGSDGNSTDNYLLVDEATPNSDTDYVEEGTVGEKDTYAYGNLATVSGTVYGVQVATWAKKTDAGSRSICSIARLSTTEVDSSDRVLSGSYIYQFDIRETKPGGGAWTISDVNSAEFGVKVTV